MNERVIQALLFKNKILISHKNHIITILIRLTIEPEAIQNPFPHYNSPVPYQAPQSYETPPTNYPPYRHPIPYHHNPNNVSQPSQHANKAF